VSRLFDAWVITRAADIGIFKVRARSKADGLLIYTDPVQDISQIVHPGDWFESEEEARQAVVQKLQRAMAEQRASLIQMSGVLSRIEAGKYPVVDLSKKKAS
jgi:hypothetical protein